MSISTLIFRSAGDAVTFFGPEYLLIVLFVKTHLQTFCVRIWWKTFMKLPSSALPRVGLYYLRMPNIGNAFTFFNFNQSRSTC